MKVGFVFECQPQGPDEIIYTKVARDLCVHFEIFQENISPLGNKQSVINDSALDVLTMLENGCEYVFIIWDRMPKWGGSGRCSDHIVALSRNLIIAGIDLEKIKMCCIDEMLESWLIADGRGVTNYFQELNQHSPKFPDRKREAQQTAPKQRLEAYNGRYNEYNDNFGILLGLNGDYSRAARWNSSFGRFVEAVAEICHQ